MTILLPQLPRYEPQGLAYFSSEVWNNRLYSHLRCEAKLLLHSQTHLEYLFIGKGHGGNRVALTLVAEPDEPGVQVYPQLPWESEASLSYTTLCKTIGQTSKPNPLIKENFLYQWARGKKTMKIWKRNILEYPGGVGGREWGWIWRRRIEHIYEISRNNNLKKEHLV